MIIHVPLRIALGIGLAISASSMAVGGTRPGRFAVATQRDTLRSGCWRGSRSGSVLLGGVAMQLEQGWKTYWRNPGDSGVPARFDFSKSDNVEAVTVLWPAPTKFDDGAGGHSLGLSQPDRAAVAHCRQKCRQAG